MEKVVKSLTEEDARDSKHSDVVDELNNCHCGKSPVDITDEQTEKCAEPQENHQLPCIPHFSCKPCSGTGYGGSDYCRVYMGDSEQQLLDISGNEEDVSIDASVTSEGDDVHIEINIGLPKKISRRKSRRTVNINVSDIDTQVGSPTTDQWYYKPYAKADIPSSNIVRETFCQKAPAKPPRASRVTGFTSRTDKISNEDQNNCLVAHLSRSLSEPRGMHTSANTTGVLNGTVHQEIKDYEEIIFSDSFKERGDDKMESLCQLDQQSNQSVPLPQASIQNGNLKKPWLFHYSESKKAEKLIKTLKDGSFVIIEEDRECLPLSPYTLLLVQSGKLRKIPLIKFQTENGQDSYSLANSKYKGSIQDLVNFFQSHEIHGLKLKLRPLE